MLSSIFTRRRGRMTAALTAAAIACAAGAGAPAASAWQPPGPSGTTASSQTGSVVALTTPVVRPLRSSWS